MKERCKPCKEWQEHFYWNHFKPKGMSFIKVMDSGFTQGMFIPVKFVKNVKRKLPDTMSLRSTNGNLWSVKLLKVPGSLLVKEGWKEFVAANNVEKKDFLVFKYDGNACFDVLIFDRNGCEKVERSNNFECHQEIKDEEYDSSDKLVSASSVEGSSTCHVQIKRTTNYRRRNIQISGSISRNMKNYAKRRSKRRQITEATAFESAMAFETDHPSFITVMRPSHVNKRCFMTVPCNFASRHIKRREQIVLLRAAKTNKEWRVKYVDNGGSWGFTAQQWRLFVFDNKLEEGDACVFELIASQCDQVVMYVHIFPVVAKVTNAVKKKET